jgi:hypothetical protein
VTFRTGSESPPQGVQKAKVIFAIDLDRFWAMYADLLTRPVDD